MAKPAATPEQFFIDYQAFKTTTEAQIKNITEWFGVLGDDVTEEVSDLSKDVADLGRRILALEQHEIEQERRISRISENATYQDKGVYYEPLPHATKKSATVRIQVEGQDDVVVSVIAADDLPSHEILDIAANYLEMRK